MPNLNHILTLTSSTPPQSPAHARSTHFQWATPRHSQNRPSLGLLKLSGSRVSSFISLNAVSGDSVGPVRLLVGAVDAARKVFDEMPHPVKTFPWAQLACSFQNFVLELVVSVLKYLSVPLLALTSISEMSYCAHERKMWAVPVPFLVGFALAGVLRDAAVELSSDLKDGEFPWHLLLVASFFILLKLPGPFYPYWGRLLIPHFANGGLWRTAWLVFMWYKRPQKKFGEETHSV